MEIDLELPLSEQDKFDSVKRANFDKLDATTSPIKMHPEEENLNSPTARENISVDAWHNSKVKDAAVVNQLDTNTVTDVHHRWSVSQPQKGLEFETKEAAYSFYGQYARSVGFGITIRASRRSKRSGKFIDVKIACSRYGSKCKPGSTVLTVNPRPLQRTDCKAGMHMKRKEDGMWIIHSIVKEHNHDLFPDNIYWERNKQHVVVNCQKKGLQLALDEGDTKLMLEYFMCMQAEDPNFFYAVDFGPGKRLRNVFWVDPKGRHDYADFCDVVFFDTFYVTEKYSLPLVAVMGVNHHVQYLLFGCALVGEETTSTYSWVMRTWLKAMGNRAPKLVITDQDRQLKEAVADIFPETLHRFCLWHIFRKIVQNLRPVIDKSHTFLEEFNDRIYGSWTDDQFEKQWQELIHNYELGNCEWFHSLYEDRKKWVPTYMQGSLFAGMSTADRTGSITAFFDKYVSRESSFKEFINQYTVYLQERYAMEAEGDSKAQSKNLTLRSASPFEKQLSTIYTDAIFKQFQDEVLRVDSCHLQGNSDNESTANFQVEDSEEHRNFTVSWKEEDLEICCSCRLFEYKGFLCRHVMLVLQASGIFCIPSHYILKRWTKNAKVKKINCEGSKMLRSRMQRFNDLCKDAIKLGELGSLSQESYTIAFEALERALIQCVRVNNAVKSVMEPSLVALLGNAEQENLGNILVKSSKKKKTCKRRKVQCEPKVLGISTQDSFCHKEQLSLGTEGQDNHAFTQHGMQEMQPNCRAAYMDSNCDCAPQRTPQVGQLGSMCSVHDVG